MQKYCTCMQVMVSLGMMPAVPALVLPPFPMYVAVMLDGRVIGHVRSDRAPRIVARLRAIKAAALSRLQRLPPDAKVGPLQVGALGAHAVSRS